MFFWQTSKSKIGCENLYLKFTQKTHFVVYSTF